MKFWGKKYFTSFNQKLLNSVLDKAFIYFIFKISIFQFINIAIVKISNLINLKSPNKFICRGDQEGFDY